MEFWEGAVLVVGGIFLIGRISRRSGYHPVSSVAQAVSDSQSQQNLTTMTNTAGSIAVVAGEPLTGGSNPIPTVRTRTNIVATQRPIVASPVQSTLRTSGAIQRPISGQRTGTLSRSPRVMDL